MELRQLRYLVAIADEGQFTRAAAREHVAQPALSQQIARLERSVGLRLVTRTPRGSTLTEAGEMLVGRARRIVAEVDAAEADLGQLLGLSRGRIVVGAMQTMGSIDLPQIVADFHAAHPGIDLVVREGISDRLGAQVRADGIDLAFLSDSGALDSEGLSLATVEERDVVAVLAPDHRLAGRKRISVADLAGEDFLSFGEGAALREILFEVTAAAGFVPHIAVESNAIPRIREMVSRGLGVSLLPKEELGADGPRVVTVPIRPKVSINVSICWRSERELSPAGSAFLEMVRERYAPGHSGAARNARDPAGR